jgi:hypothetical protein
MVVNEEWTFTACRDPEAESVVREQISETAGALSRLLGRSLEALLLVGGYARGEGSVVRVGGAWGGYNDYDLVAILRDHAALWRARRVLRDFAAERSRKLGIEVDLWPTTRRFLRRAPATLFWLDVCRGGVRVISGDPGVLGALPRLCVRGVPLDEAGRLLANRAVGIALSNLEPVDHDHRRRRHIHKAALACGDALLLAIDRYPATVRERLGALRALAGAPAVGDDLVAAYEAAARFRRRPDAPAPREDVPGWYEERRDAIRRWHLAFESRRIHAPEDPADFAAHRGALYPGAADVGRASSTFSALRAGARGAAPLRPWCGHPRERLARVAVALAYGSDREDCRRLAARWLGLQDGSVPSDAALHAGLVKLAMQGG